MRRRHDLGALLKYMGMLEDGYSIGYISDHYGIDHKRLCCLWLQYQKHSPSVLHRKPNIRAEDSAYPQDGGELLRYAPQADKEEAG